MVPVKDIHIQYNKSGDQLYGRLITALLVIITEFTVIQEYFDTEGK